jgi:plastocyanin
MTGRLWISALAVSAGVCSVAMADVTGKATFNGPAPKPKVISMKAVPQCEAAHTDPVYDEAIVVGGGNELKNVVVYVKDGGKLNGEVPKEAAVLDQIGCVYTPHVVAVMVGQDVKVRNSDAFLHNVHGLAQANGEFNFPQTQKGDEKKLDGKTQAVETYKVKCDVHPWMAAWVVVVDSPFFAVTGDNGEFAIKGLKDGKYTLVAWQERLGTQEAQVEVKDGKATADFKFEPKKKSAAADSIKAATEVLVSKPAAAAAGECEHCKPAAAATLVSTDAKAGTAQAAAK